MTVAVVNLATLSEKTYCGLSPREAVIAAYAQDRGDWNTWGYSKRYGHLVRTGKVSVSCGDWAAILCPAPSPQENGMENQDNA